MSASAKALDLLKAGLGPFADREVENAINAKRLDQYGFHTVSLDDPMLKGKPVRGVGRSRSAQVDVGHMEPSLQIHTWHIPIVVYVFELRNWRNKWAHQGAFFQRRYGQDARLRGAVAYGGLGISGG